MEIQFLVLLAFCSIWDWFCANALSMSFFFSAACLVFTSCTSCIASQIHFNCSWCHRLNRWENKPLFIHLSSPIRNWRRGSQTACLEVVRWTRGVILQVLSAVTETQALSSQTFTRCGENSPLLIQQSQCYKIAFVYEDGLKLKRIVNITCKPLTICLLHWLALHFFEVIVL